MVKDDTILVIGHKNPDPDAICSAIAYAAFKEQTGHPGHLPARCGNSNPRIDVILKTFNTPLPAFYGDVTPRLKDIMVRDVIQLSPDATCAEALRIIDEHDIRALPVVNEDHTVEGTISIFQLGQHFIPKVDQEQDMRIVHTCIESIIRALNAEVVHAEDARRIEKLFVRVGAMDVHSFGRFSRDPNTQSGQTAIIVGDRRDIQEKSIQLGVRLLVVTGGLEVEQDIVDKARERRVSLIVSPYDTATTAWIIRTATRVSPLIDRSFITFGSEERVRSVRQQVGSASAPIYLVLDDNGRLLGVFTKTQLLRPVSTRLVLVDHNELSQAVQGAEEIEIVEVIDHHRLGSLSSEQPILFINQPVGSTCTIVADLFRKAGLRPTPELAGIMMSGMISDTLNLNSPTTTDTDRELLSWLSGAAEISPQRLGEIIFSSGSVILSSTPEEVVRSDLKIYDHGDIRYAVSQVEEVGYRNFLENMDALRAALKDIRREERLFFASLLVTDINTQNSLLLVDGETELLRSIRFPKSDHKNLFELSGIVSRKKQLIPSITTLLRQLNH